MAPQSAPAATAQDASTEQLRDYVGAFVLAGLDPKVGSETEFFADHVASDRCRMASVIGFIS